MKIPKIILLITGWFVPLAFAAPASAGTVTITSGPNLAPPTSFTNNTFMVIVAHNPPGVTGDQIQGSGGATVIPPAGNVATVDISGTYSANAGDIASVAYSVTMDSTVAGPVAYATSADVTFLGNPLHFEDSGTITPGLHLYHGLWQAPISFPVSGSGSFMAMLTLTFPSNGTEGGTSGAIAVSVEQLHIQLATTAAAPRRFRNRSTFLLALPS